MVWVTETSGNMHTRQAVCNRLTLHCRQAMRHPAQRPRTLAAGAAACSQRHGFSTQYGSPPLLVPTQQSGECKQFKQTSHVAR